MSFTKGGLMRVEENERTLERVLNRQTVLRALLKGATTTRVRLAEESGLSRPTVNSIVGELERENLVEVVGASDTGGRSAALYRLVSQARTAIGIDLGGSKILAAIADVTGHVRAERVLATEAHKDGLADRLAQLCRDLLSESGIAPSSLTCIAIGTPGVSDPATHLTGFAANIPELSRIDLRRELSHKLGVEVVLDNDVNMAVIGERWKGLAQRSHNAVFIAVGKGLGMGIVAGGQLQRGHSGAAGEVGFIPLSADPFDGVARDFGPMEELVSAQGIVAAYEERRGAIASAPLDSAEAVFAEADRGNRAAIEAIDTTAKWLAQIVVSVQAVLDPERVVIGGGVGSNVRLMRHLVAHLDRLGRRPPIVEQSSLEGRAALLGALAISLRRTQLEIGIQPDFDVL